MSFIEISKPELIKTFQIHDSDTGSSFVQVAILTREIQMLSQHLALFKKDNSARRSLLLKIGRRLKLLKYLRSTNKEEYKSLIEKLNIKDKFV